LSFRAYLLQALPGAAFGGYKYFLKQKMIGKFIFHNQLITSISVLKEAI
jgi:hypothetical protein